MPQAPLRSRTGEPSVAGQAVDQHRPMIRDRGCDASRRRGADCGETVSLRRDPTLRAGGSFVGFSSFEGSTRLTDRSRYSTVRRWALCVRTVSLRHRCARRPTQDPSRSPTGDEPHVRRQSSAQMRVLKRFGLVLTAVTSLVVLSAQSAFAVVTLVRCAHCIGGVQPVRSGICHTLIVGPTSCRCSHGVGDAAVSRSAGPRWPSRPPFKRSRARRPVHVDCVRGGFWAGSDQVARTGTGAVRKARMSWFTRSGCSIGAVCVAPGRIATFRRRVRPEVADLGEGEDSSSPAMTKFGAVTSPSRDSGNGLSRVQLELSRRNTSAKCPGPSGETAPYNSGSMGGR